jgi:hypothetical protein
MTRDELDRIRREVDAALDKLFQAVNERPTPDQRELKTLYVKFEARSPTGMCSVLHFDIDFVHPETPCFRMSVWERLMSDDE